MILKNNHAILPYKFFKEAAEDGIVDLQNLKYPLYFEPHQIGGLGGDLPYCDILLKDTYTVPYSINCPGDTILTVLLYGLLDWNEFSELLTGPFSPELFVSTEYLTQRSIMLQIYKTEYDLGVDVRANNFSSYFFPGAVWWPSEAAKNNAQNMIATNPSLQLKKEVIQQIYIDLVLLGEKLDSYAPNMIFPLSKYLMWLWGIHVLMAGSLSGYEVNAAPKYATDPRNPDLPPPLNVVGNGKYFQTDIDVELTNPIDNTTTTVLEVMLSNRYTQFSSYLVPTFRNVASKKIGATIAPRPRGSIVID